MLRWTVLLLATACGGSHVSSLVAQHKYNEACEATDYGYDRTLADSLAERSNITITLTPWRPADALAAANITTPPHDDNWLGLEVALDYPASPSAVVVEASVADLELRAEGWIVRGGFSVYDSYHLLTGKTLAPRRTGVDADDIAAGIKGVVTNNAADRAQLSNALAPEERPDDLPPAEALAALFANSCAVTPGTMCRGARFIHPHDEHITKPAALAFTVRYAVANAAGAHCTQMEHVVVPLAAGADLAQQLAATFTGPQRLVDLRARARVYGAEGESAFFEYDRR